MADPNRPGDWADNGEAAGKDIPINDANKAQNCSCGKPCSTNATESSTPSKGSAASSANSANEAERLVDEVEEELADKVMGKAAEELKAAKAEVEDWKDRYMRLHAEWDTYRRRINEQREEEKLLATEKLVANMMPVLDDFERSIGYADQNGDEGLLDGVKAIRSNLLNVLEKSGVEVIDPEGMAFDALEAQAVATVQDATVYEETVHEVYQKGFRMGRKVLRPAMVTVTVGGPRRPKEDDTKE